MLPFFLLGRVRGRYLTDLKRKGSVENLDRSFFVEKQANNSCLLST